MVQVGKWGCSGEKLKLANGSRPGPAIAADSASAPAVAMLMVLMILMLRLLLMTAANGPVLLDHARTNFRLKQKQGRMSLFDLYTQMIVALDSALMAMKLWRGAAEMTLRLVTAAVAASTDAVAA